LGAEDGSAMVRSARAISTVPDLPPALPRMGALRGPATGLGKAGQDQACRVFHRRDLCGGEKGGSGVGKTKRGKGTKLRAVADGSSLPVAVYTTSASPHEVTLVDDTLSQRHTRTRPQRLIGDLA